MGQLQWNHQSTSKSKKKIEFVRLNKRLLLKKTPIAGGENSEVPFNLYCPSMQGKLYKGICPACKSYWPSAAAMLRHAKCHRKTRQVIESEGSEIELESEGERREIESESESEFESESERESNKQEKEEDIMPTSTNIFDILASPFMEVELILESLC